MTNILVIARDEQHWDQYPSSTVIARDEQH
jgi:hypothetical protein